MVSFLEINFQNNLNQNLFSEIGLKNLMKDSFEVLVKRDFRLPFNN